MEFEIVGDITDIETIAVTGSIRELDRLRAELGQGRWRKLKGRATVQTPDGVFRVAELHWYEANGIGRRRMKIKRFLD